MSSSQRSRRYVRRTSYAAESSGEEEDAASDFSLSDASVASDPSATQKTPSATQKTPSVARKTPSVIKKKKTSTPSTSKKQSDTKKPAVAKKSAAATKKDSVVISTEPSKDTNKKSPDASPKETTKDAKPVQKKKAAKKKASTLAESYDIQTSDTNEYTLLIQVDPNQSLDLTGAVGAVGRFETDEEGGECGLQNVVGRSIVSLGLQSFLISRVASTTVVSIPALRRCFSPTYIPKSAKATMALQCYALRV